jgi:hypothetical protein
VLIKGFTGCSGRSTGMTPQEDLSRREVLARTGRIAVVLGATSTAATSTAATGVAHGA